MNDFDGARGSPVWAAHQGVETATAKDFGRAVVLNHNGFSTLYAHLNKIRVKYGETVRQGQRIGDIGSSGLSTGPHLHFEHVSIMYYKSQEVPLTKTLCCSHEKKLAMLLRWRLLALNRALGPLWAP